MPRPAPSIEYMRAPLHRYTFSIRPIREWVEANCSGRVLNLFAGKTELAVDEYRIDLDPSMPADEHLDALVFLETASNWSFPFATIVLDPPYSYRKSMELYSGHRNSRFNTVKNTLAKFTGPGAKVITFGYHSVSMGMGRGFQQEKILLISHGGAIHDTIAVVEVKRPVA